MPDHLWWTLGTLFFGGLVGFLFAQLRALRAASETAAARMRAKFSAAEIGVYRLLCERGRPD